MSMRYQAGIVLPGYNALKVANAPTIGTATAGTGQVSVAFTAPSCVGGGAISSYTAYCTTTGTKTASGASSPITVTGLTNGTAYTFKVIATNVYGPSYPSASSNSATPAVAPGQQAYTSPGTYSWVAPSCVTSVSVVAVGGGDNGSYGITTNGGGGGALAYANNISVTPGNSYTVVVGGFASTSSFNSTSVAAGGGSGGSGGSVIYGTGGSGGSGSGGGGGGAGGYAGSGGSGSGGSGGNGGSQPGGGYGGGGGGGVGILGQGSSGANGAWSGPPRSTGGGGGSGGNSGNCGYGQGGGQGCGGAYGGGGGAYYYGGATAGASGAVRIIWPGNTRSFPSTNTGNL